MRGLKKLHGEGTDRQTDRHIYKMILQLHEKEFSLFYGKGYIFDIQGTGLMVEGTG